MKGIKNKIVISQDLLYTFMGYTITKGNYKSFFSEYVTFSVNFNVSSLGGTTSTQTILDLVPRCLKRVWCYRRDSFPYAGFEILKVILTW
jgi:hypothetical protein